jgi:hypothetical protein
MGKATSAKKTAERKEGILQGLANGMSLAKACLFASCPDSSCHRYRQLDSEFAEEVTRLLSSPEHAARIAESQGSAPTSMTEKEAFLFYYETAKDRAYACNRSGIRPTDLLSYLNGEADKYDPEFADAFRQLLTADEMRVQDIAIRKAIVGKESSMVRFLLGGGKGNQASTINVAGDLVVNKTRDEEARARVSDRYGSNKSS